MVQWYVWGNLSSCTSLAQRQRHSYHHTSEPYAVLACQLSTTPAVQHAPLNVAVFPGHLARYHVRGRPSLFSPAIVTQTSQPVPSEFNAQNIGQRAAFAAREMPFPLPCLLVYASHIPATQLPLAFWRLQYPARSAQYPKNISSNLTGEGSR